MTGWGALLLACGVASGRLAAAPAVGCGLVSGWSQAGGTRAYTAENLFEYMDGNSEGYLLYGFDKMTGVTCERGGATLVIDVSDFGDSESAFGMFSANRDLRWPSAKVGAGGQIVPRRAIFTKGKYYVEIAANPEGDYTQTLQQWAAAIEKTLEGTVDPPAALAWFPPDRQQSLRLAPESVLGLRVLTRGYVAEYEVGKAFVVAEESAGAAAALMQKLRAHFGQTSPAGCADEAFQANDPYLGRLAIFRKGRYVGGYANVAGGQDPARLAVALAARVP